MNTRKETDLKVSDHGFTLVELSMVIIIVGFLLIPFIGMYSNYYKEKRLTESRDNIREASSYMSKFFSASTPSRYPCPADPALPVTDPNYGIEDCTAGGAIITTPGARTAANVVYIGAIPITTIRNTLIAAGQEGIYADIITRDGYDNKLTYAVTSSLTSGATYRFYDGQITALDEFGNPTAGINDDTHFVIISHGKNGSGAYGAYGNIVQACPATGPERDNCNGDASFVSALGNYEGNAASYIDDASYFVKSGGSTLWSYVGGTNHIFNLNTGNVGIKNSSPSEKVDVNGIVRATNNIKTEEICTKSGTKCFDVNKISGSGFSCGAATQVMVGISNSSADCVTPAFPAPVDTDCSPGWVMGLRSDGTIICSP